MFDSEVSLFHGELSYLLMDSENPAHWLKSLDSHNFGQFVVLYMFAHLHYMQYICHYVLVRILLALCC